MRARPIIPGLMAIRCLLALFAGGDRLSAQDITRAEALRIGESYVQHRWHSALSNVRHGKDHAGIEVHTPDRQGGRGSPLDQCWQIDTDNIGVAYKWGGSDSISSYDNGIKSGKAAGDVFTPEKRRLDDGAVSDDAVGVDCSGFVCRCWKTATRYSTQTFPDVCHRLASPSALQPADIMNQRGGHVVMFVKWLDTEKKRALFYEAAPFSKTTASEKNIDEMLAAGFIPMRYQHIRG